ncbi:hypothetical protein DEO72_LG8g2317 [Vigna unguiculata]|uniref:Uncharacterized protein n=1 Tax=Vigna unguiculata TaxID=3917 RepID=A0A4D6MUL4_VIGUN|nr:hypothetical protein DEO72_LG8g2317 [Vigna unguiculata]
MAGAVADCEVLLQIFVNLVRPTRGLTSCCSFHGCCSHISAAGASPWLCGGGADGKMVTVRCIDDGGLRQWTGLAGAGTVLVQVPGARYICAMVQKVEDGGVAVPAIDGESGGCRS